MSTPRPTDSEGSEPQPAPQPMARPADPGTRGLKRLLIILAAVTAVLFIGFGVVYYLGQHTDSGPTLADRDVTTAEQAVRDDPNNVGARLALAASYLSANRTEEALAQYVAISQAEPKNRAALLGSGTIRFEAGDFTAAKTDFENVIKLSGGQEFSAADPQLERAYYYLGVSALRLGDVQGALTNLQSALAIDKTDADAWYALGGTQVRAGDYKAAAASYQRALDFVPTGWCDPYEGLSVAYDHLKSADGAAYAKAMGAICADKSEEGVPALEALAKKGDFAVPAMLGLGFAAEKSGDADKAIDWFTKVTDVDPSNIPALTALARLGASHGASTQPTPDPSASRS